MTFDLEKLTAENLQKLIDSPALMEMLTIKEEDKELLAEQPHQLELAAAVGQNYVLSDWFWTGNTQFRVHRFSVQGRKEYARVRLNADIPENEVGQYTALISCIVGTAGINAALAAAFATGITAPVVLGIIAVVAVACFSQNGIPYEVFKGTIKDAYLEKRWGAWG
jgi:hypothetical protein